MAEAQPQRFSLRWSRLEKKRLLVALIFSLVLHIAGMGVYRWGVKQHWWQPVKILSALPKIPPNKKNLPPPKPPEEQVVFVDVSHEEKEPPPKAKYYSNKNSQAANPEARKDLNDPKIEGKQTVMPKTESGTRPSKLAFATPAPTSLRGVLPAKTETSQERGDLDVAQKTSEQKPPQPQTPPRPRTLKEAQQNLTQGEAMKQDGGVKRVRVYSSLDAKQTPFGNYDKQIVDAVTDKWYAMLDNGHFAQDRTGKVVVRFKLKYDGTILEMSTLENTVGISLTYVCRQAIAEAAPFARWPDDMRRMIGANFREVSFTFYYY
jgi:hypothetical protein